MGPDQTDLPAVFELVVPAGTRAGQVIAVDRAVLRIGRQTSNDVVLPDAKVSRQHARLEQQGDGLLVTDEGSSNGTYVNGSRITTPTVLRAGDILAGGASHLRGPAGARGVRGGGGPTRRGPGGAPPPPRPEPAAGARGPRASISRGASPPAGGREPRAGDHAGGPSCGAHREGTPRARCSRACGRASA